ncbi:MAG: mechanosensitive ion channel [Bacteroidetes bacterium]|nr:mechanosensitive ion channel [Bacteroidota bacterium]
MNEKIMTSLNAWIEQGMAYAPKVLLALISLIVGFWIAGKVTGILKKKMAKSHIDKDVQPFLASLVSVGIKIMVVLSVASIIGVQTTSFIAVLGAATLAVGMALQGSLGNLASGVMILIFKPYRVGDLVDVQGQLGHVDEIQIFNTLITSLDHKKIIMPNSIATSGIITNLSTLDYLRVDLNVHIPYESDFESVRGIIMNAILETPKVLTDPAPYVEIESFDESGLKLCVRPHATVDDYWDVYFGTYRNVKAALGKAGIQVPYPVRRSLQFN